MQIVQVEIKNFRGIKSYTQSFYGKNVICFVGRGDSGKSTILEAISYALSSNWNILFNDTDFYKQNTSEPIEIDVSVQIPEGFILESKYGQYLRFYDKENNCVCDELKDEFEKVLTIKLKVEDDLEPRWYVYNNCQEDNLKEINNKDRARFNCFLISDYLEKHFTWSSGSPLYALSDGNIDPKKYKKDFIEPMRTALNAINNDGFTEANNRFNELVTSDLINIKDTKTLMDTRDVYLSVNKLSLHDSNDIPYRLSGKGTRRLLSTIIQLANIEEGSITLIDEVEQGLEPDRVKRLVSDLKNKAISQNQVFITTHSDHVITELEAKDIFIVRNSKGNLETLNVSEDLQDIARGCPDAFFGKKILVCEGKTELGICRALDEYRKKDKNSMSYKGVIRICGEGSNFYKYAKKFKQLKYDVLTFCDSDLKDDIKKKELIDLGTIVCDCEKENCIEKQIFVDLPFDNIIKLVEWVIKNNIKYNGDEKRLLDRIKSKAPDFPNNWRFTDSPVVRQAFADASIDRSKDDDNTSSKSYWFKNEDGGKILGDVIFDNFENIGNEKCIKKQINQINNWIDEE